MNYSSPNLRFTHNLRILLIDAKENIVDNDEILKIVKEKLKEDYTHPIYTSSSKIPWNITIKWELKDLTKTQSYFMGDLFACPSYDFDSIIYEHTETTLKQIEKDLNITDYKIKFHISRMPYDKGLIKGSFGFV